MKDLKNQHCTSPEGSAPLSDTEENAFMQRIGGWSLDRSETHAIGKSFSCDGYDQSVAFFNRIAETAKQENHHPDVCVGYNQVDVTLSTHKIGGLHPNDFIMAAKIDAM